MNLFLLILGLTVLVLSGDWLVRCASSLAVRASIPPVIVGLTIVSIGTSAPEVIASVRAALEGNPGIAIGNVIGSNIANLALILGVAALVQPIVVTRSILRADWPVLMVASLLFAGFAWDGQLENWEGGVLCTGTVAMLIMLYYRTRQNQNEDTSLEEEMGIEPPLDKPLIWLFGGIIVASIGLYYGSEWFIEGARELALQAGVSDHIIGLTVVAFGTSVPELVASVAAVLKRESDLVLGNLIGSNIFNIFLAIGVSSSIIDLPVDSLAISQDFWWMLAIAALVFPMMLHRRPCSSLERRCFGWNLLRIHRIGCFERMTPEIILEDGKCRCLLFSGLLQNERAEHWIEALPWQQNEIRMFGRTHAEPRLTTWMGPAYRYASIQWSDTPFSDEMARLMNVVQHHASPEKKLNAVLANLYRDGQDAMGVAPRQ